MCDSLLHRNRAVRISARRIPIRNLPGSLYDGFFHAVVLAGFLGAAFLGGLVFVVFFVFALVVVLAAVFFGAVGFASLAGEVVLSAAFLLLVARVGFLGLSKKSFAAIVARKSKPW